MFFTAEGLIMRHEYGRLTDARLVAEVLSPEHAERVLPDGLANLISQPDGTDQEADVDRLVFSMVTAFRAHPHISNVMTHISRGSWARVEAALRELVDPTRGSGCLSPLARNLVDLCCAERGVTGRIMKPFVEELLVVAAGRRTCGPDLGDHDRAFAQSRGRGPGTDRGLQSLQEAMMTTNHVDDERVVEVALIEPRLRHTVIRQLFETLPRGGALQLVVDHEPRPLRMQFEGRYGAACSWSYLEEGPDVWRVRLVNAAGPAGASPLAADGGSGR